MLRALVKKSKTNILKWISLSVLVLALIIEPGVFSKNLFVTGAQPQETRAYAQTPGQTAPQENNKQKQPDKQDKSDTKKDSEGELNVFIRSYPHGRRTRSYSRRPSQKLD